MVSGSELFLTGVYWFKMVLSGFDSSLSDEFEWDWKFFSWTFDFR